MPRPQRAFAFPRGLKPAIPTSTASGLKPVANFGTNPGNLTMQLYVPKDLPAGAPLVVVLHGCTQTAADYAEGAGWVTLARRFGFALLCPEQTRTNNPNLCFNWFQPGDTARGAGEAASIAAMVEHALSRHGLDPSRYSSPACPPAGR